MRDSGTAFDDGGAIYVVEAASRPAGGTWSPPTVLSSIDVTAFAPHVAVSPRGDVVAVWNQITAENRVFVAAATRSATGAWSSPTVISAPSASAFAPQVAIGPDGRAIA